MAIDAILELTRSGWGLRKATADPVRWVQRELNECADSLAGKGRAVDELKLDEWRKEPYILASFDGGYNTGAGASFGVHVEVAMRPEGPFRPVVQWSGPLPKATTAMAAEIGALARCVLALHGIKYGRTKYDIENLGRTLFGSMSVGGT